jgi:hypothetical protein
VGTERPPGTPVPKPPLHPTMRSNCREGPRSPRPSAGGCAARRRGTGPPSILSAGPPVSRADPSRRDVNLSPEQHFSSVGYSDGAWRCRVCPGSFERYGRGLVHRSSDRQFAPRPTDAGLGQGSRSAGACSLWRRSLRPPRRLIAARTPDPDRGPPLRPYRYARSYPLPARRILRIRSGEQVVDNSRLGQVAMKNTHRLRYELLRPFECR